MDDERAGIVERLAGIRARRERVARERHRLAEELRAALAAGYRAGVPVPELARAAGVRRETAWAIIRQARARRE